MRQTLSSSPHCSHAASAASSRSCALRQRSAACALVWSCANAAPLEESAAKHATPFAASRARRARRHKSTATRRGSSSFFGCEARDGCQPLALEEEEDEASASSPFEANAARGSRAGRGARAAPKPRTPPRCTPPPRNARAPSAVAIASGREPRRERFVRRPVIGPAASSSSCECASTRRSRARAGMDRRRSVDRRDAQKKRVRVNKTRFVALSRQHVRHVTRA